MIPSLSLFLGRSSQKQHSTLCSGSSTVNPSPHIGLSLLFEDIKARVSDSTSTSKAATRSRYPHASSNADLIRKMDDEHDANRTFAIVKPDALTPFKYQQIDALIKLNEFSIARQKFIWLSEELADALFPDKATDSDRQEWLDYITGSPSLALELEKVNAPLFWQITMGAEDPGEVGTGDTDSIRGILAVDRIRNAVDGSQEPEDATKHLALVFSDKVPALPYDNFLMERAEDAHSTLAIIKPDVSSSEADVSRIIRRIVARGYTIKSRIDITLSRTQAQAFYAEHNGKPFFDSIVEFMTSGPIVALSLDGDDVIRGWRMMIGPTDPDTARMQAPQSIRALLGSNSSRNAVHGSDSPESAQRELAFFFFPRILPDDGSHKADEATPVVPAESNRANGSTAQNGDTVPVADASTTAEVEAEVEAEAEPLRPPTGEKKKKKQKKRRTKRKQTGPSGSGGLTADPLSSSARNATHASDESDEEKTLESAQSPSSQAEPSPTERVNEAEDHADDKPAPSATCENIANGNIGNTVVELAVPTDSTNERTFGLIKPDAYPRYRKQLIKHIVENGLIVVAQEEVVLNRDTAERIYEGMKEFPVFPRVIDFVTSGPVLALVLEGRNAVANWRNIVGPYHPRTARLEDRSSLRAKYGQDAQRNAIHASKGLQEVQCSIKAVFYDLLGGKFSILQPTDDPLAAAFPAEKADLGLADENITVADSVKAGDQTIEKAVNQRSEGPSVDGSAASSAQTEKIEANTATSNGVGVAENPDTVNAPVEETPLAEKMESISIADVEPTVATREVPKPETNGAESIIANEDSTINTDSKDENIKHSTVSSASSPQNGAMSTIDKPSTFGSKLSSSPFLKADRQLSNEPAAGAKRIGRIKSPFLGNERPEPVASSPSSTASKSVHSSPLTSGADVNIVSENKAADGVAVAVVDAVVNDDKDAIGASVCEKMAGLGIVSNVPTDEKVDVSKCATEAKADAKVDDRQEEPISKSTADAPPEVVAGTQFHEEPKHSSEAGDKSKPTQPVEAAKKPVKRTDKEADKEPVKEADKEPVKEAVKKPVKEVAKVVSTSAAATRPLQRSSSTRAPAKTAQEQQPPTSAAQRVAARRTSTLGSSAVSSSLTATPAAATPIARGSRRITLGGPTSSSAATPTSTRPTRNPTTTAGVGTKAVVRTARVSPSTSQPASGPSAKTSGTGGSTSLSARSSASTTTPKPRVAMQPSSVKGTAPTRQPSVASRTRATPSAGGAKEVDSSSLAGSVSKRVPATRTTTAATATASASSASARPRGALPSAAKPASTARRAVASSISPTKAPSSSVPSTRAAAKGSVATSSSAATPRPRAAHARPAAAAAAAAPTATPATARATAQATAPAAPPRTAAAQRPTLTRPVGPSTSVVSTASSRARAAKAAEARLAEAKAAEPKTTSAARTTTRPLAGSFARRTIARGARAIATEKTEEPNAGASLDVEGKKGTGDANSR